MFFVVWLLLGWFGFVCVSLVCCGVVWLWVGLVWFGFDWPGLVCGLVCVGAVVGLG